MEVIVRYSNELIDLLLEYLGESDVYSQLYYMDSIDEFGYPASEAIRMAFNGGRYGYENDQFNPNDTFFSFDGYGNLESVSDGLACNYLHDYVDSKGFCEWANANGHEEEVREFEKENQRFLDEMEKKEDEEKANNP